jgi:hypothetical protein
MDANSLSTAGGECSPRAEMTRGKKKQPGSQLCSDIIKNTGIVNFFGSLAYVITICIYCT